MHPICCLLCCLLFSLLKKGIIFIGAFVQPPSPRSCGSKNTTSPAHPQLKQRKREQFVLLYHPKPQTQSLLNPQFASAAAKIFFFCLLLCSRCPPPQPPKPLLSSAIICSSLKGEKRNKRTNPEHCPRSFHPQQPKYFSFLLLLRTGSI